MFLEKKFIFLTFSDFAVKAVVIEVTSKKPKVIFSDKHLLPEEIVIDEKIKDSTRFKEEVRKFLLQNKESFKTKKVIFGINEQEVYFSTFATKDKTGVERESLAKHLETLLPFNFREAVVRFSEKERGSLQLVITRASLLRDLSSIFTNTGFSLVSFSALPLAGLDLLKDEAEPYLFILEEDQSLQFGLVIEKTLVFSSSLKLNKTLQSSKSEIVKTIKRIIDQEYETHKLQNLILHNIFIVGSQAEIIKVLLNSEKLRVEVVDLFKKFSSGSASDWAGYSKALLISFAAFNPLNFNPRSLIQIQEAKVIKRATLNRRWLVFTLAAVVVLAMTISGFNLFNQYLFTNKQAVKTLKTISASSSPQLKIATRTSQPLQPPPAPPLNKADYTIEVLNGTNTPQLASKAKDFLVSQGYKVVAIGNAATADYQQTVIQIKPSKQAIGSVLTATLQARYSVITGNPLAESTAQDVIITIGKK